jgi:MFS transporter, ACS family, hexuronate transporter
VQRDGPAAASPAYQWTLTGLLSLNFGFVLLDRNALSFLMPFVQPELGLDNSRIGMLSGGLSLTWALAAFGVGYVADRFGSRKRLLIIATLLFALCSVGSGFAMGFAFMLATRLVMGVAEGGIMPLSQSLIASQVDGRRRGLAMGITQGFGSSLMGSFVAPVALVWIAEHWGWRNAFFLAGAPGLLIALLIGLYVRDAPPPPVVPQSRARRAEASGAALSEVLMEGNVLRCLVMSIAFVGYLVVTWTFMPLYLVQVRKLEPATMSWVMGVLGIAATLFSFAITGLSDRIGRRPVMIVAPLLALILPLCALYLTGPTWLLAAAFFVGWTFTGIMPLFMATVPAESVGAGRMGMALGLCMGGSEILGGVLAPIISGQLADRMGLQAPLWTLVVLALVGSAATMGLRETAPRALARRAATAQV